MSGNGLQRAIEQIKRGGLVIVGDPEREGEYDFIASAKLVTEESFNLMLDGRGAFVAVFMPHGRCKKLGIHQIPGKAIHSTRFMVSVDGTKQKSGSSLLERLSTVMALGNPKSTKCGFVKPGHVVPIEARAGLLKERMGHTEAGVRLMELAGINPPVAVDMEILDRHGRMVGLLGATQIRRLYSIPMVNIDDIARAS